MIKVALLFLTVSGLNHESHWNDFLLGHQDLFSIYAHSKNNVPSNSILHGHIIPTVATSWKKTMRAQIALLKAALADPANQKFIFLSESTIPLHDASTIYHTVLADKNSIFKVMPNPHQDESGPYFYRPRILKPIPSHHQMKNSQWIILNRKHAELMVQDNKILPIVTRYPCDNEHYPSTFLACCDLLNELTNKDLTYFNWKLRKGNSPFSFDNLYDQLQYNTIVKAIKDGYLFARKFPAKTDLSPLDKHLAYRNAARSKQTLS